MKQGNLSIVFIAPKVKIKALLYVDFMKKQKAQPFIMVSKKMLADPVYRKLSSSAQIIYIYMRNKLNGKYGLSIVLTYKEMNDVMGTQAFSRATKELIEAGFIDKVEKGGLFGNANVFKFIGEHSPFYYKGVKIT